jgi:ribosomal protein L11 methyltransferase
MISNIAANATTLVASLETDEQSARRIADLIAESFEAGQAVVSLVDKGGGRWLVAIHFGAALDEQVLRALTARAAGPAAADALRFEHVAATDWVRESLAGLAPVTAGRFIIHGAHDRARIPVNRIGIEIEAALAFGTGHHGTTRGCLLALDRIGKALLCGRTPVRRHPEVRAKRASKDVGRGARAVALRGPLRGHLRVTDRHSAPRILDLGTGSGVLAIAAARALHQRALATDNDARAVQAAHANAALNHVGALVEVVRADGVTVRRLRRRAPFDLIFANILLRPLQRFAAPLTRLAAPGGRVVLSGLLAAQANAAIAAYRGLVLERRIDLDGWTTLVFVRPPRRRPNIAQRRPAP